MFEDSFLDSFMESHIGGWTPDTEHVYDDDSYDDGYYDEDDEHFCGFFA